MKIANQKEFAAGLLYVVVGAGFAAVASTYSMGALTRMGPGLFPLRPRGILAASARCSW